jgi:hypothetical protein
MAAPDAPPIKAPLAVLSGRPLGVVHPASRLAKPIALSALTTTPFTINLSADTFQLSLGSVLMFVVERSSFSFFMGPDFIVWARLADPDFVMGKGRHPLTAKALDDEPAMLSDSRSE